MAINEDKQLNNSVYLKVTQRVFSNEYVGTDPVFSVKESQVLIMVMIMMMMMMMIMNFFLLGLNQVLPGVAHLVEEVQVEGTFPDGTKLVSVIKRAILETFLL